MGNENKVISHRFQMFCLLKITLHRAYLEILLIIWSALFALFGHLALDFFSPIQSVPVCVCKAKNPWNGLRLRLRTYFSRLIINGELDPPKYSFHIIICNISASKKLQNRIISYLWMTIINHFFLIN